MSYNYVPQKIREYDLFLRNTRAFPSSAVGDTTLWKILTMIEALYRKGKITRQKAALYGMYIKKMFNIDSVIISDSHIIFLPRNSKIVEQAFFSYPQLMAVYGNRNSGKTITAWTIALRFLEKYPNSTLYVYGDVDGLGKSLMYENEDYEERIIVKNDYKPPEPSEKPKIAIYNELAESLMGKKAMSIDNIKLNLQALRNRHRKVWIIYNVIRYTTFESTLRDTADITLYKWMSPTLLQNLINNVPRAYGELLKNVVKLNKNESLAIVPLPGKGIYFGIYETDPPKTLLRAHKNADKNIKLMMTRDEKDLYIYERIAELKEKGLSGEEISILLRQEGINLTARAVNIRYNKWKRMREIEAET